MDRGSGGLPVLGSEEFQALLAAEAERGPGYDSQAFEADRLFAVQTKTIAAVGYRFERTIHLGQSAGQPCHLGCTLFPPIHALNVIDGIVFVLANSQCCRLYVDRACEFQSLTLEDFLETERLCLSHNSLPSVTWA